MEKCRTNVLGTKPSSHNGQLLISSGISSLDNLLGGGLPVGTIALIEEDLNGCYSKIVLKYFLAEGIVNNHSIFVASQDTCPYKMVKKLPAVIAHDPEGPSKNSSANDAAQMKIAFRYQNLSSAEPEKPHFSHHFDLTKTMPPDNIENSDIQCWNGQNIELAHSTTYHNPVYNSLLRSIKSKIKAGRFFLKDPANGKRTVLRIGVHCLGSPMWLPGRTRGNCLMKASVCDTNSDMDRFIFCLRALVRSAYAVAVVTVPAHLYRSSSLQRCIHSSDIAMRLQSFSGTELEHNSSLSDYQGFFHLTKLAAIGSLTNKHPGAIEYVFKLRRKKLQIETLHLPPDIQESNDNKKEGSPSLSCGSTNKHLLDF